MNRMFMSHEWSKPKNLHQVSVQMATHLLYMIFEPEFSDQRLPDCLTIVASWRSERSQHSKKHIREIANPQIGCVCKVCG